MSRESFLKRVREAAAAGRRHRSEVWHDLPLRAGYVGAGEDPLARLAAEVNAVGSTAHLAADLTEARGKLEELLDTYSPQQALCWQHELLDQLDLAGMLRSRGIETLDYARLQELSDQEKQERLLAAEIGISSVTYAVAETGTLAVAARPGQERLASLLPPVHLAVVQSSQVLPDLFDLFEELQQRGLENLPGNLSLITGPSKTGDIELQLTTGVHGPGTCHVLILRSVD